MCPLLHVLPNGLAAEAGNPLLDTAVIVPGMCLSIIWFVFVRVLFLKWFERRAIYKILLPVAFILGVVCMLIWKVIFIKMIMEESQPSKELLDVYKRQEYGHNKCK